jgi:putative GTP pyrophosphokinase
VDEEGRALTTKGDIDRLGERLRSAVTADDLRQLDAYRRSFRTAYVQITTTVKRVVDCEISGRPAKSTTAIIDKLKRGKMRLTQMQDIAGCRMVVGGVQEQDRVVELLVGALAGTLYDRREKPSHGYRAVHVVAFYEGVPVEVQVRTQLQHKWAELCEKMSDVFDPALKYGGGDEESRATLDLLSKVIERLENAERTRWRDGALLMGAEKARAALDLQKEQAMVQTLGQLDLRDDPKWAKAYADLDALVLEARERSRQVDAQIVETKRAILEAFEKGDWLSP